VAYFALCKFGRGRDALGFFHARGYRWWHFLPDGTFSLKCPFLQPSFHKALFFGTKRQRRFPKNYMNSFQGVTINTYYRGVIT